jgi:hypothetical protein
MRFDGEFALAVMTGHAFQVLVSDDDVRASLKAICRALVADGRFVFETRNPSARAWEGWDEAGVEVVDPTGRPLRVWYDVESVDDGVVTLTETTSERDRTALRVDRGKLRFLDAEMLDRFLAEARFDVKARYGGWQREPFTASSEEIITMARPVLGE